MFTQLTENGTKKLTHLFTTSEYDFQKIYIGDDNKYYCKRFGLPYMEMSFDAAITQAWLHLNRSNGFNSLWDDLLQMNIITDSPEEQEYKCILLLKVL